MTIATTAKEKVRILVVDDDAQVRDLLSTILSGSGVYQVDVAMDGLDGLRRSEGTEYDIIFTDLAMPKMDGMEFLKKTRQTRPYIPMVMITGAGGMDIAVHAMKEGASDFITKPFKTDKILATTERILGEKKLLGKIPASEGTDVSLQRLNAKLFRRLQEIVSLHSISTTVDRIYDNKEIFQQLAEMVAKLLLVDEVVFGIIENGILRIRSAIGVNVREIPIGGTAFESVVLDGQHRILDVGEAHPISGMPAASQCLVLPLLIANDVFGVLSLSGKTDGISFSEEEVYLGTNFARKVSSKIENNALYEEFYNNLMDTLKSLIATVEARDSYTKQHSERVTRYSLQTAERMGLGPEEIDAIRFSGFLHDIGKIGVRDTVLLKPGGLTREEFEEICRHPVLGDEIVRPIKFFKKEREIIRHHHEKFDGTGYPDRIGGKEIPLVARILTVSDSFDAMTTNRPYREAKTRSYALSELTRCSGTQFDPEVVKAFLETDTGRGTDDGN